MLVSVRKESCSVGRLAGWPAGWLLGWLVGSLLGCFFVRSFGRSIVAWLAGCWLVSCWYVRAFVQSLVSHLPRKKDGSKRTSRLGGVVCYKRLSNGLLLNDSQREPGL